MVDRHYGGFLTKVIINSTLTAHRHFDIRAVSSAGLEYTLSEYLHHRHMLLIFYGVPATICWISTDTSLLNINSIHKLRLSPDPVTVETVLKARDTVGSSSMSSKKSQLGTNVQSTRKASSSCIVLNGFHVYDAVDTPNAH